ncbi:hypothetical protein L3Q82_011649, partial [Scortum barcoo]
TCESMDLVDVGAAASTGDRKRHVNKKNRDWHKRLDLRKTAVQTPAMQSQDKHRPKKIAEEWERGAAWPSSKKPPRGAQRSQRRTHDSGNTLRFMCSQCRDNLEYVPKDLVRHFGEKHRGSPPVFPCHTCTFTTHEFSYLQVHLLSHKDTFSSCSICNDNVQRTWPEFSAHLTMCHCKNDKYSCEMCQTFSTSDVRVFLEHTYVHNLGLEGASDDLSPHAKDGDKFGPKTTAQTLRCQHCGYEASQKWLLAKHVKAVHVCQNGTQRKKKKKKEEEVHSIAMKPNDPIPKIKPRLTRSAVREMCWLTQDCLSLPGREFLDKYCHLSDPQTTLEETQQFLMKSVAGETGDQKWTKALKTVLSNVPQDINLHSKSENGITSNASDLTVLTVKNKITVAQNGAAYAKRLQMMTSSDKETLSPESAPDDARCVADQNGCQSNLNDHTPCPQTEAKLYNDASVPVQHEPSECSQMQENRENRQLKRDQEMEENGRKHEEPVHEDEVDISSELRLTNKSEKQTSAQKVIPKNKRQNRRRKKARCKKLGKRSLGLALKLVLKKNPVKEKQWVSQSSLASGGGNPHAASEGMVGILQNKLLTEAQQKKWTKASKTNLGKPSEAITSIPQSNPGQEVTSSCAVKAVGSKNTDRSTSMVLNGLPSMHQEMQDDAEKSLQFLKTDADDRSSTVKMSQANWRAAALTEVGVSPMNVQLQTSGSDSHVSGDELSAATDAVTPHHSCTKSSSVSHPVITPQGKITDKDLSLARSSEQSKQSVEEMRDGEVPADSRSDLLSNTTFPAGKAMQQEPSPACGQQRQLVLKNLERTLKLVAINPSQLVKRPVGDQPVVVLNHPDADIPEVARIMEVINRYRGEVQKVILSRRTVKALSAMNGEAPETNELTDAQPDTVGHGKNSVQERFLLKLTLRRLSRKKYEVVGAVSPSRDDAKKFRCWFCGRAFASQEPWKAHRQRHLMEWKRPNCENS